MMSITSWREIHAGGILGYQSDSCERTIYKVLRVLWLNCFEFILESMRGKRSRSFLPARSLTICENQALFRELISKGQYNLSFGLNSTTHAFLNPINSQWGNPCFPGKLRLAHKEFLPDFSDRTVLQTTLQFHSSNEGSLALFLLASGDPFIN